MATTTVKPNADGTGATNFSVHGGPSTRYGCINNGTATPDDTDYIYSYISEGGSAEAGHFGFANMPVDFGTATGVTLKVRQRGYANDDDDVSYQLFQSDGTTALSDEITLAIDGSGVSTSFRTDTVSLTRTGATSKSVWNGVQLKVTHEGPGDGDDPELYISEIDLEITYTTTGVSATLIRYPTSTISDSSNAWGFYSRSGTYTDEGDSWGGSKVAVQPDSPTSQDSSYGAIDTSTEDAILEMNCQAIPATANSTITRVRLWAYTSQDNLEECSVRVGGTWNTNNVTLDGSTGEWDYFDFVPAVTDMSSGLTLAMRVLGSANEDFYSECGYLEITYLDTSPPSSGELLPMLNSAYGDDSTEL